MRGLRLHLHELARFSELLSNQHIVYDLDNPTKQTVNSSTMNMAKWLRLASQIETVELNPYQYQEGHLWCEPIADKLESNAKHHASIITPLTLFMFVTNALEECHRFSNFLYEQTYQEIQQKQANLKRMKTYSMRSEWLMDRYNFSLIPTHYAHLVENYLSLVEFYTKTFDKNLDLSLEKRNDLSFGLSLVRKIRNQIAHGVFPIIEDPEYTFEFGNPKIKSSIIQLLLYSSRIASLNIQILLSATSDGFESGQYKYLCSDEQFGEHVKKSCTLIYLQNLHIEQKFALNESALWNM